MGKISDIKISEESSWENRIFLSFDLDWAHDSVLSDTIDIVEHYDVCATWFVTHETPLLNRLRENPKFELGIHPNFNGLLEGNHSNGSNVEEVVIRLIKIVPEATAIRSHSLFQTSRLCQLFADLGMTHECNHLIPEQSKMTLKPWPLWNGLIKVPHYWEDDAVFLYNENSGFDEVLRRDGLKVFDFHPIHVFLNTENIERYNSCREFHYKPDLLAGHRYDGFGTRSYLKQLLKFNE